MKKKIISLLLIAAVSSTALMSCGKTKDSANLNNENTTEQSSTASTTEQPPQSNSKIVGENNKPTVEVKQIASLTDFKDKDKSEIEKLLGKAISEDDDKATYEKDDYSFEIKYKDSKCNEIKIIPKSEMKFPADGTNILKLVGINADDSDSTISPAGLEWNNKFDTFKINVVSNNEPNGKISYVTIILSDPSK